MNDIEHAPAELAEWALENARPEVVTVKVDPRPGVAAGTKELALTSDNSGRPVWSMPDREQFRLWPERRTGTTILQTLDAFIAYSLRFADGHSGVFLNVDERAGAPPTFLCVFDYHRPADWIAAPEEAQPHGLLVQTEEPAVANPANAGTDPHAEADNGAAYAPHETGARWGQFRARYAPAHSDAWNAWKAADGRWMGQKGFAEFLEERIQDVLVPTTEGPERNVSEATGKLISLLGGKLGGPSQLLGLARDFAVTENSKVRNATSLNTGEVKVQFEIEHATPDGQPTSLTVPTALVVGLPVFEAGESYGMLVRLRYRIQNGQVQWSLMRHRPDIILKDALDGAADAVHSGLGLPVFRGWPQD